MDLIEFIKSKDVDYTKNVVTNENITTLSEEIGIIFGNELTDYCLRYGYLGYKYVEFYGINSKQMSDSDMVKQTKYLHKYFPKTLRFIAFENTGDGNYMVLSSNDDVYEYSSEQNIIKSSGLKLYDYILKRFQEIDNPYESV